MMGAGVNGLVDFPGMIGNDQQGMLSMFSVHHMHDLGGGKLIDNRIQRSVPSKQKTCNGNNKPI